MKSYESRFVHCKWCRYWIYCLLPFEVWTNSYTHYWIHLSPFNVFFPSHFAKFTLSLNQFFNFSNCLNINSRASHYFSSFHLFLSVVFSYNLSAFPHNIGGAFPFFWNFIWNFFVQHRYMCCEKSYYQNQEPNAEWAILAWHFSQCSHFHWE